MKGLLATDALDSPVIKKMSFYPSFILAMYSLREIISSPDLLVWNLNNSEILALLVESSWTPNFKFFPNYS